MKKSYVWQTEPLGIKAQLAKQLFSVQPWKLLLFLFLEAVPLQCTHCAGREADSRAGLRMLQAYF